MEFRWYQVELKNITNNFGFRCVPNDLVNLFGLDSNDRNFDYQIAITRKRQIFLSFESDLQIIEGIID